MNDTNEITENQCLDLSALVSNEVTRMTGQPITESEDCDLAITISAWLHRMGFTIIKSA